jgi:hypothetical protein
MMNHTNVNVSKIPGADCTGNSSDGGTLPPTSPAVTDDDTNSISGQSGMQSEEPQNGYNLINDAQLPVCAMTYLLF